MLHFLITNLKHSNSLNFEFCNYNEILRKPQNLTQKKIAPENFKQIRTVNDVVIAIENLLQE